MTLTELQDLLAKWIREDVDDSQGIRDTKSRVDFLSGRLFDQYRASSGAAATPFRHKLADWLSSESDETNRKMMFRLLNHLFFFGNDELEALYRTAYSRNIIDWIISTSNISLLEVDAREQILAEIDNTCFVALTDSFRIGDFIRINSINGVAHRIVLSSIKPLPTAEHFNQHYLRGKSRLVLLEDFVGSASQVINKIRFATELGYNNLQVLFCPLIICPKGDQSAKELAMEKSHLTYDPVLALPARDFITPALDAGSPAVFSQFRQLAKDVHSKVGIVGYGPLGYADTGALVIKADNCPDNTLPLIHHSSNTPWSALFLRHSRGD